MDTVVLNADYRVGAGESLLFESTGGFWFNWNNQGSLFIDGTVTVIAADRYAVGVSTNSSPAFPYPNDGQVVIGEAGALHVTNTLAGWSAIGHKSGYRGPDLVNHGLLEVTASDYVEGANLQAASFENTGVVRVSGDGAVVSGVSVFGSSLSNRGTIEVSAGVPQEGDNRGAVGAIVEDGRFFNTGEIRVTDANATFDATAVKFTTGYANPAYGPTPWTNSGLLQGEVSLLAVRNPNSGDTLGFRNEGQMIGRVDFQGYGAELFTNTGRIEGDVNMGVGADRYDGASGHLTGALNGGAGADTLSAGTDNDRLFGGDGDDRLEGAGGADYVRGEAGNDTLEGGAEFDDLHGNMGDDVVRGGAGDDWVVGGKDQDQLFGDDGWDVLLGNMGHDTVQGGLGGDWLRGGQDNDLVLGGDGDDWIAGDKGADTLTGGAGADIFHTWAEAGLDRVTDFDAAAGDRVNLLAGTTYTLAQVGADTVIDMGAGNHMVLANVQLSSLGAGWIFGA